MPPSRFLVTGCARSGTGFTATLLTSLGLRCGHEAVFHPRSIEGGNELRWPDELPGESSWLAAPFLSQLPPDLPVFHQVRDPLSVVRSKLRTRFFDVPSWYKSFAERMEPALIEGSPAQRAARYWLTWNGHVERFGKGGARPYLRYRVEDLDEELVVRMAETVGASIPRERIREALASHPRDYNTRGDRSADQGVEWASLGLGKLEDEVRAAAARYGYGAPRTSGV